MEHKRYVHWGLEHMGQKIVNLDRETCEKLQEAVKRRGTSYEHLVHDLIAAIFEDLADAKSVCGGDGKGCEAYRAYYDSDERRHQKCSNCPMGTMASIRQVLIGD